MKIDLKWMVEEVQGLKKQPPSDMVYFKLQGIKEIIKAISKDCLLRFHTEDKYKDWQRLKKLLK